MILALVAAHNIVYSYIAPYLSAVSLGDRIDVVLLVFGAASLLSIWVTGALIDGHLRILMVASAALFAVAMTMLAVVEEHAALVFVAAGSWGLAFGGVATLVQTALAEAAGRAGDVAQSLSVVTWNVGMAAGGIAGGLVLTGWGPQSLPWTAAVLAVVSLVVVLFARTHGFRTRADRASGARA
nr:MFS transporter [Microbacterium excoecariae]